MRLKITETACAILFILTLSGVWLERPKLSRMTLSPARWPEKQAALEREQGPMRYLGRVQLGWGGFDVYEERGGQRWWAVGWDGRWEPASPGQGVMDVTDQMLSRYDAEQRVLDESRVAYDPLVDVIEIAAAPLE